MLKQLSQLLLLFLATTASVHAVQFDSELGARDGDVRIVWYPKQWSADIEGAQVLRRKFNVGSEVIATLKFDPTFKREWLDTDFDAARVKQKLLSGFDEARRLGFAMIDPHPLPDGQYDDVQYQLRLIVGGKVQEDNADIAFHKPATLTASRLELRHAETYWNEDGPEILFATQASDLRRLAVGYRIFETRAGKRSDIGGGLHLPHEHFTEWSYICVYPRQPYAEAYEVVAEDEFGFPVGASATFSSQKKTPRPQNFDNMKSCDQSVGEDLERSKLRFPEASIPVPARMTSADAGGVQAPARSATSDASEKVLLGGAVLHLDAERGVTRRNSYVIRWQDVSPSGNDAVTDSREQAPLHLRVGEGGPHVVSIWRDGVLRLVHPLNLKRFTIFIVGQNQRGGSSQYGTLLGGRAGNRTNSLAWSNDGRFVVIAPDGNRNVGSVGLENGDKHVLAIRWDGKALRVSRNGQAPVDVALRGEQLGFSLEAIGAHWGQDHLDARIYRLVVFDRTLAEPQIADVVKHLKSAHGIAN